MSWEDNVRRTVPYTPGEQPKISNIIKLNTNENPYPPSPSVAKVLSRMDAGELRKYPDPAAQRLTDALSAHFGVPADQIFVGVGSDDVLAMSFLTFFNSGKKPAVHAHTAALLYLICNRFVNATDWKICIRKGKIHKKFKAFLCIFPKNSGDVLEVTSGSCP